MVEGCGVGVTGAGVAGVGVSSGCTRVNTHLCKPSRKSSLASPTLVVEHSSKALRNRLQPPFRFFTIMRYVPSSPVKGTKRKSVFAVEEVMVTTSELEPEHELDNVSRLPTHLHIRKKKLVLSFHLSGHATENKKIKQFIN